MAQPPDEALDESLRRTASEVAKINDFIISLLEDPARLAKFRADPDSLLKEADLSPQAGEALKFGDRLAVLREATGGLSSVVWPLAWITWPNNLNLSRSRVTIVIEPIVIKQ